MLASGWASGWTLERAYVCSLCVCVCVCVYLFVLSLDAKMHRMVAKLDFYSNLIPDTISFLATTKIVPFFSDLCLMQAPASALRLFARIIADI